MAPGLREHPPGDRDIRDTLIGWCPVCPVCPLRGGTRGTWGTNVAFVPFVPLCWALVSPVPVAALRRPKKKAARKFLASRRAVVWPAAKNRLALQQIKPIKSGISGSRETPRDGLRH
jgi:hypothetical protein